MIDGRNENALAVNVVEHGGKLYINKSGFSSRVFDTC